MFQAYNNNSPFLILYQNCATHNNNLIKHIHNCRFHVQKKVVKVFFFYLLSLQSEARDKSRGEHVTTVSFHPFCIRYIYIYIAAQFW